MIYLVSELVSEGAAADVEEQLGLLQKYWNTMPETLLALAVRVVIAIIIFLIGSKIISVVRKIAVRALQRTSISREALGFIDSAIKGGLYALLILQIALQIGVEAASIATIVGSVGVTIGLAVQGSLSNLIGGILILTLKPFKAGDYIIEDSYENEGTVKEITLFYTKLATVDNQVVLIPNGTLANTSLTNVTDEPLRKLDLKVGISYNADIRQAKKIIQDLMDAQPEILSEQEKMVFVDELGANSVMIRLRCWIAKENYWAVRWRMLEEIKYAFDDAGIGIPYNQLDVHIVGADGEH